jgi:glycosyltransferase involved in cell wall biosynthesis
MNFKGKYPKITIVTPSFNQGLFLEATITSIINQGYPNLEYIIIDGGSNDNSVEIIKKYADKLTYWESSKDKGQTHAILKGFERASGDILTWVNSDDCLTESSLFKIAEIYSKEKADYYVGNAIIIDEHGNEKEQLQCNLFDNSFNNANVFIVQPASFFTKEAYDKFGPLDINLYYSMDMDFWLKIYFGGGVFKKSENVIALFREHGNTKTSNGYDNFIIEIINKYLNALKKNEPIISQKVDNKILRIKFISLLKNGSLKRKIVYLALISSIPYLGLNTFKYFGINIYNTLKRMRK